LKLEWLLDDPCYFDPELSKKGIPDLHSSEALPVLEVLGE